LQTAVVVINYHAMLNYSGVKKNNGPVFFEV
jgi:hypothetical protein